MTTRFVRQTPIGPRAVPVASDTMLGRCRRLLFPTPAIGVLSPAILVLLVLAGWRFFEWAVIDAHWRGTSSEACPGRGACWAFVLARWKPWLVGN
jgi:general L-amino acid transport system permease protein